MNGKIVAGGLVITGIVAYVTLYWLQVYAYYDPVSFPAGQEITLVPIDSETPEAIVVTDISGIDSSTSPVGFRACFTTPLTQATLTETYRLYPKPTPLNAPGWFGCFNADEIGEALERGEALAFLSRKNIAPGVDRVVAVFSDGRAYAWHQLNDEASK